MKFKDFEKLIKVNKEHKNQYKEKSAEDLIFESTRESKRLGGFKI